MCSTNVRRGNFREPGGPVHLRATVNDAPDPARQRREIVFRHAESRLCQIARDDFDPGNAERNAQLPRSVENALESRGRSFGADQTDHRSWRTGQEFRQQVAAEKSSGAGQEDCVSGRRIAGYHDLGREPRFRDQVGPLQEDAGSPAVSSHWDDFMQRAAKKHFNRDFPAEPFFHRRGELNDIQ